MLLHWISLDGDKDQFSSCVFKESVFLSLQVEKPLRRSISVDYSNLNEVLALLLSCNNTFLTGCFQPFDD